MPFIPDEQLEEVRSRADIVQVIGEMIPLKRAGRNFKGLCPFHNEKSPSFMVHPEKQIFRCFGCGEGGDVFSFLMKHEGVDFSQAVERLAERYGITLTRLGAGGAGEGVASRVREEKELLYRINRFALRFFYEALEGPHGKKGRDYLEGRGIQKEMFREFYLGYAPAEGPTLVQRLREKKVPLELAQKLGLIRRGTSGEFYDFFKDRLLFAIVSSEGKILGFSGRALEENTQPKYLNSPESAIYRKSETLLGLHLGRASIREKDQVILVEGNFDLLRLHQEGVKNAVAPLGTALTEKQVRYLRRFTENFILLFDGDEAGSRASERSLEIFLPMGLSPRVVLLPPTEDPDSFVRTRGVEPLRELISLAPSLLEIRIEHILKGDSGDPQEKVKSIRKIAELLSKLPGEIEKRLYIQKLSERFGLSEEALLAETAPQKGKWRKESNFSPVSGDQKGEKAFPPIERTLLEVLLSGHASPAILLEEIKSEDFSHQALGEVWNLIKEDYQRQGRIDLAHILSVLDPVENGRIRRLLTELAFAGSRWKEEGGKVVMDCMRQIRMTRLRGRLKDLSQEIRKAERQQDFLKIQDLLDQKNRLIKEMTSLH